MNDAQRRQMLGQISVSIARHQAAKKRDHVSTGVEKYIEALRSSPYRAPYCNVDGEAFPFFMMRTSGVTDLRIKAESPEEIFVGYAVGRSRETAEIRDGKLETHVYNRMMEADGSVTADLELNPGRQLFYLTEGLEIALQSDKLTETQKAAVVALQDRLHTEEKLYET